MTTPIAQGPVDVNVSRQCTCHPDDNPPQPCEHRYAFRDCADAAEERYLRETLAMLQEISTLRQTLDDANGICRSAYQIAERNGSANWPAFRAKLAESLERQHKVMYPIGT